VQNVLSENNDLSLILFPMSLQLWKWISPPMVNLPSCRRELRQMGLDGGLGREIGCKAREVNPRCPVRAEVGVSASRDEHGRTLNGQRHGY
jgi:hypothetical protein